MHARGREAILVFIYFRRVLTLTQLVRLNDSCHRIGLPEIIIIEVRQTVIDHMLVGWSSNFKLIFVFYFWIVRVKTKGIAEQENEFVAKNASGFHTNRILEFIFPKTRKENIRMVREWPIV